MTVPHHSEPAREAVELRRAINEVVESVEMEVDLSLRPMLRKRVELAKALCERPASPAPAAGGLEAVLTMALQALEHSKPVMAHYEEPVARHKAALEAVIAALASPAATSGSDYAGDITPHDDKERGLTVLRDAYDFDIADDGTLCGLVSGDQGWASTHIRIKPATSAETQGGDGVREALAWAMDEIDTLSNKLCQFAYPQGMAMLNRADQFPNYEAAIRIRSSLQPDTQAAAASAPEQAEALPAGVDVEALTYRVANAKLGEGPSVRCEGPTDFEKDQSRAWVKRVLAALSSAPAQEGRADG